jgi:amidase
LNQGIWILWGRWLKNISHLVQGMELLEKGFAAHYSRAVAAKLVGKKIRLGRLYLSGTDPRIDSAIDRVLSQGQFQVVRLDEAFKDEWDKAQRAGIRDIVKCCVSETGASLVEMID